MLRAVPDDRMTARAAATSAQAPPTILGDWGTTRLRLYLCDIDGNGSPVVREVAEGPGAKSVSDFATALLETAARLRGCSSRSPVVLAGMVGSDLGWRETAYAPCPATWDDLVRSAVSFNVEEHSVAIMPGTSCVSRFGYMDVMRGEETQLLGVSQLVPDHPSPALVCLPGTHTKWATIDAGGVTRFATTVQGEMFEILRRHSILLPRATATGESAGRMNGDAFSAAVDLIRDNSGLGLLEALFATRSLRIAGELAAGDAESWLSGLLVSADIRDTGLSVLASERIDPPVLLVGDDRLGTLYAAAMSRYGIGTRELPGDECIVAGLAAGLPRESGGLR